MGRIFHKTKKWISELPLVQRIKQGQLFNKASERALVLGLLLLFVFSTFTSTLDYSGYANVDILTPEIEELIRSESYDKYDAKLEYAIEDRTFHFNSGYSATTNSLGINSGPKFSAAFPIDADEGITVVDPFSSTSIKLYPLFGLKNAVKDGSRVVYPLAGIDGYKVLTLQAAGYKEDIVLENYHQNNMEFSYRLELLENMEARLEADGSVGIYGISDTLLGNVATGSDEDAELLEKLKNNQELTNLLYTIPAPYVRETGTRDTKVGTYYSLEKDVLTVHVRGLVDAKYPLTIDPSVYVDTAQKLSRGNNETNIDFDVSNELIQKGATTGGRFVDWENTMALDNNYWDAGTAVANGYIYSIGGALADDSMYMTPGESEFVVPSGVTSISVKAWGAGGGGGGASEDGDGGAGGGGGYAAATLSVTAGEVLTIRIGEGGKGGRYTAPDDVIVGDGGSGGGYSGIFRSTTALVIAGGGGGGGGDNGSGGGSDGGAGGAGGGTSGVAGTGDGATTGGGAGTSSAGGAAGATTTSGGTAGSSLQGGTGASNRSAYGDTSYGGGGAGGKGDTGLLAADRDAGGGGGGGGYYGGGGGGASNGDTLGGGGGGGGSGYVTGTSTSNTAGSGTTPGNSSDTDRNGAGDGGAGGVETSGIPTEGTEGDDGLVLVTVTSNQVDATDDVWWAAIDSTSQDIDSPNPGAGACTQWCNNSTYDLPAARKGASVVAYNGYIYVVGGENASGTRQTTVYIGKLGANGEPSLWYPGTDPTPLDKSDWSYWVTDTALSTEKSYASLVAYNNRIYLLGGQTNASTGGVTEVLYSEIEPDGTLAGWTSTGMTALPSARHNHMALVYNDHMYLIGGNSSGTIQTAVHYINLDTDGTMIDSSWISTTSLDTSRMAWGGKFAAIYGGFIYIAGGCSAVNGSGYCTSVRNDVRLVSINANGSLAKWTSILDVTNERIGHGLEAWGGALYTIGGCRAQNATTGDCDWGVTQSVYGDINPDGDASTVRSSELSGTSPCDGASPTDCHLPPEGSSGGQGGNMSGAAVINNGVIYYFGGCTAVNSGSICYTGNASKASDNIFYAAIGNDGRLERVSSCADTWYGNWCVDNANTIPQNLAGMGVALFDNTVYLIGGTDGTAFNDDVFHMTFNSDGSIGSWSTQTFTDLDLGTARGYPYAFTRANPSSAGTYPGNLFVLGGCAPSPIDENGVDCSDTQFTQVYKCNITTTGALETADANDCTTSGQVQIDSEPSTGGSQGLGAMSGTVYANYVYLIGGQSPNESERGAVMYAKLDDSNNIVDADGETTIDNIWETSPNEISPVRRRGAAFGYNGYLYSLAGYNAGETLNDLLYAKIDVSDGSIGSFVESDVTVLPRWDLQAIVSNGYVYTLGGCATGVPPQDCQTMERTVQTFQLYNNYSGSPASYSAETNLFTTDRIGASAAVYNGYMYIAGGCTSTTDCTNATNNTQYAQINADGTLGTWSNTTDSTLPADRTWGQLEVAGGTLYYIGGQDDTATNEQSTVYYGTPSASTGDISTWSTATNGLPAARTKFSAAVWNDRIYVTGGLDSSATDSNTVYYSPDLSSGGDITSAWTSDSDTFDVAREGHTTIAYANNLYVFGGYDGSNYLNDVQFTQINSDGSVDAWTFSNTMPDGLRNADGFAANGYLYIIGGRTADATCDDNTWVTPISANTTISSGNNPTGIGAWYETIESYTGDRYGASVVYNDGVAYALGGGCGATITYTGTNRIVKTAVQSQPQVARYSYYIDADTDVFPSQWLVNGLDNDIGARWFMNYRSSTDANNEWGQNTNFGAITLGNVETYTPLDDTGTDTEFARYYFLQLDIDSSEAYGYPDDVTRGPTIDDISLFFTADPAKSLRHGKTFIQGLQQPLYTPPP
ncbi:MAG: hypothetical protein R3313_00945 [Candidatus Saccharimonadales bacterium]|nr:hypothetical protein [Candidatus Saccharimonadales bacterium]